MRSYKMLNISSMITTRGIESDLNKYRMIRVRESTHKRFVKLAKYGDAMSDIIYQLLDSHESKDVSSTSTRNFKKARKSKLRRIVKERITWRPLVDRWHSKTVNYHRLKSGSSYRRSYG